MKQIIKNLKDFCESNAFIYDFYYIRNCSNKFNKEAIVLWPIFKNVKYY